MSVSAQFLAFVLDQLGHVCPVVSRPMFGGVGLYADGAFFAIVHDDTVFLKVDDSTRGDYTREHMQPFQPSGPDGKPMGGYYELPPRLLEDAEELAPWMKQAIAIARQKSAVNGKRRPR